MAGIDSYVQLMLHCDGTNGSTTFVDSSQNGSTQTVTGSVAIDTSNFEFATGSAKVTANSSHIDAPYISAFELGSGNFTVDCWVYLTSTSATNVIFARTTNPSTSYLYWQLTNGTNATRLADYNSGYNLNAGNGGNTNCTTVTAVNYSIVTNTWTHVALERYGNTLTFYQNGVIVGQYTINTISSLVSRSGDTLQVAGGSFNSAYRINGSMDEFRYSVGIARYEATNFTPPSSPYSSSTNATVTPSTFNLLSTLYSPSLNISSLIEPSTFTLTSTLYSPIVNSFTGVTPSTFNLTSTLYSLSFLVSSTIHPSLLTLTATLHQPNILAPGTNSISFASAILSYNPLIIVSNTNLVKVSIVDVSTPDNPIYTTHSYAGCSNATAVSYNSDLGMIYVSCANGIILEINASSPTSYTINYTGASGNLTSLTILPDFFDVYAGTDYSTGEAVNMYEGTATTVACDVRFSASYQSILGTQINTINSEILSTDIRFVGIVNNIVGCDIRFISTSYADLSITPIARTDFIVYIGGIEVPDVKLDSIEITHTADQKSQATFILARKHDNINYVLNPDGSQGISIPVLGHPTVQITIQGNEEFGYDTPAYIWDVDCKSENEQVRITAYSELPKTENTQTVTLSIPLLNEQLHVYHALIDNPVIDNPVILPDDINPPFYLGILIDNGYTRIENITQYQGFFTASQTEDQFVNYVFGSGDSGITDINGKDIYFKPLQNWTYFWFGHATNFITGQTWEGLLPYAASYLGTSPSSLTTTTWDVDYINFWYQREFPNSVYRGAPNGTGSAIVYPSDFLGIVPFPYNPDPYDKIVNINPFNGNTTIDQVLRDHTPMTFSGSDILNAKTQLAVFTSPGSTLTTINGINYLITLEGDLTPVQLNMSTKILDLIDSKFGITFGTAPFKKVSCKSGILTPVTKWEDAPNGLFYHKQQGYNYVDYVNAVGEIEFTKIQNINGSVLPKTKCDVEVFLDGYYYYNLQLLTRINIDQTTQTNIYDGNNGFPVSVKSIHISSKDMKVTLDCTNAWSRLELLELEGQIPDPYYSLIPEVITEYSPKFDPNSLMNIT